MIYKICTAEEWQKTLDHGQFPGAPVDLADGYIHFSTATQVRETARRYFNEINDLRLFVVAAANLGDQLKWEPSRGGDLFPHFYGDLPSSLIKQDSILTLLFYMKCINSHKHYDNIRVLS